jgi:hypothetical protein
VALTYPVAFKMTHVGRVDNGDGQFSIWNVAWVARTLVVDPLHVFDANIFYPHHDTLAYSENNLGAGFLAIPAYWTTHSPYAALNSAMLLAFILCATGTYYLVRYLTHDRAAAAIAAIGFAFCPYAFAHTAHIQLMMTAGLPFSLLAFHRLADRPTRGRGVVLGATMAAQAMFCGYYGVFVILIVGCAFAIMATTRGMWLDRSYWFAMIVAAATAILIVTPAFLPYVGLQRVAGFHRDLEAAASFSANWSDYFASSAYAHAWMLAYLPPWTEATFPGFVPSMAAVIGLVVVVRRRDREMLALYGGLAFLACWASFGPRAGLYAALYRLVPLFAWLRAPARFGLVVDLAVAVLAGVGVSALLRRLRRTTGVALALAAVTVCELAVPLRMPEAPPVDPVYRVLATLPRGPLIEMPFFYPEVGLFQHEKYMLASTAHWLPMVNGYSDYIPPDFYEHVMALATFPSRAGFDVMAPGQVRYAVFHMYGFNDANRHDVELRLQEFAPYMRLLFTDAATNTRLYEILGFPP